MTNFDLKKKTKIIHIFLFKSFIYFMIGPNLHFINVLVKISSFLFYKICFKINYNLKSQNLIAVIQSTSRERVDLIYSCDQRVKF
jgi:hypothetical protein